MQHGSSVHSFNKSVYEVTGLAPDTAPVLEDCAAVLGDPVVAPGRACIRRDDAARQQAVGAESPQYGIDGAFLEEGLALVRLLKPLCNFVAVEVFGGPIEHGEQDEGDQAGVEVLLEFPSVVVHGGTVNLPIEDSNQYCRLHRTARRRR